MYLLCTAKPAFVGFWFFSIFVESTTYLFSAPLGRSIPSLATIIIHIASGCVYFESRDRNASPFATDGHPILKTKHRPDL